MNRILSQLLFLVALGLLIFWKYLPPGEVSRPPIRRGEMRDARVLRVSDGDTLTVEMNGRKVRVRLHGVDAPETEQPGGLEARAFLRELLPVKSRLEVQMTDRDRYGRIIGIIGRPEVNRRLVREGHAWAYRKYSTDYVAEEEAARRARRGLWSAADPIPPWEFRRRSRP